METITELRLALNAGKAAAFIWEIPTDEDLRLHGIASAVNATADQPDKFEAVLAKVHPEDWDSFEQHVRKALDQPGHEYSNEYRLVEPDGRLRWIEDIGRVEFYTDRRSLRLIGLATDITARKEAERQRADAESRIRAVVNHVADGIITIDENGTVESFNPAAERVFGYAAAEVIGQNINLLMPEPYHSAHDGYLAAYRRTGQASVLGATREVVGRRKDGSTFPLELSAREYALSGSRRFIGIVRDITDRKRAEETLRLNRERLEATQLHAPIGIEEMNLDGKYLSVNDELCHITGYSRDELLNLQISDLIHPDDWPHAHDLFHRLTAGEIPSYRREKRYIRKDGSTLWVDVRRTLLRDADGKPQYVVGAILDISDRRRAEEQLRAAEGRFRTMADAAPVLIWQSDEGGVTFVNSHYLRFFGVGAESVVGMRWADFLHPDDRSDYLEAYRLAFERQERYEFQCRFRRHDGEYRWLHNIGMPHHDGSDKRFVGFIGCSFDVTDSKRAEEALIEADRQKDEFLATLAHELRNPLAPIRNGLEVMKLAGHDAEAVERCRSVMERQVEQMVRLVDDLLDVSRITRGKVQLKRERVRLAAVVSSAVETSGPLIDEMGHELTITQPEHPVVVDADPTRLTQVFMNLLNNAAKYSERGGHIWLTVEQQGSDVLVSVRDTGIGIDAANLPRIFDLFSQVDRSLEKAQGGLGIGLSLVKRLVEMHDGRIEATSEGPGRGSEFVVRLPVVVEASVPPTAEREEAAVPKSSLRILIVDDNKDGADSLAVLFNIMGNDTRTAYDGQEGIEQADRYRPDVALFDIGLPKLNGYEACRRIREQPWGKSMVLIAVTGWGKDEDRRRSHDAGFDHHMVKPVDPQALMKLLAELNVAKVCRVLDESEIN